MEAEYLKFDERPNNPMYSNWDKWRTDPSIELKEIEGTTARMRGAPHKAKEIKMSFQ